MAAGSRLLLEKEMIHLAPDNEASWASKHNILTQCKAP